MTNHKTLSADDLLADIRRQLEGALDRLAGLESLMAETKVAEADWLDTSAAASRFGLPVDTIRWLAREKGCGRKDGGRWLVSVSAMRRHRMRMVLALNAKP